MAESAKDVAERLAGPHHQSCEIELAREYHETPSAEDCDCPRRERVAAIEAAIREAEELARADERRLPHCSIEGEDWYQDALAEARRQGRAEAGQEAGALLERESDHVRHLEQCVKEGNARQDVWRARAEAAEQASKEKDARNRVEEEAHAKLQARCYEGFPSISDGIFDALKEAEAERDALREENARLKEAAIIAGTTQANLHDVIRERDKENARLLERVRARDEEWRRIVGFWPEALSPEPAPEKEAKP